MLTEDGTLKNSAFWDLRTFICINSLFGVLYLVNFIVILIF